MTSEKFNNCIYEEFWPVTRIISSPPDFILCLMSPSSSAAICKSMKCTASIWFLLLFIRHWFHSTTCPPSLELPKPPPHPSQSQRDLSKGESLDLVNLSRIDPLKMKAEGEKIVDWIWVYSLDHNCMLSAERGVDFERFLSVINTSGVRLNTVTCQLLKPEHGAVIF